MRAVPLLLTPHMLSLKHSVDTHKLVRRAPFFLLGLVFWLLIYVIFVKVLIYFRSVDVFGDILAAKLFSMVFLFFFTFLLMSNIITGLSTFYLSKDLEMLLTKPIDIKTVHSAKTIENFLTSSWMVIAFALPVLIAYARVYEAGLAFYLLLLVVFVPFLLIPSGMGVIITHVIAKIFPAKNARDVLMLLAIIFFVVVFMLFRFLQPERFLNPDSFPTLLEYLSSIGTDYFFMPYYWITHALLPVLTGTQGHSLLYVLVILSNALFFMLIASGCGTLFYADAINKSQDARKRGISLPAGRFTSGISKNLRNALLLKDLRIFLRDASQWPQLLLLVALVIIYLYNFKVLPLEAIPGATFIVSNFIAFINLMLAGFVLSAIAARFLFPAVSLEGQSFWVIKSSPVTMREFLRSKLVSGLFPLIILSQILVLTTNIILQVTGTLLILSSVTILLMCLAVGGLGIGLGAVYPKFTYHNIASIPMGFGGILFMILGLFAVALTVLFEAWPLYLYLTNQLIGNPFGAWETVQTVGSLLLVIIINIGCFYVPMKIGIKSIEGEKWM